jgi:methylated-DNA-[protein]-cysteine S-methyltransferase
MLNEPLAYTYFPSPVGDLLIAGVGDCLHFVSFPSGHKAFGPGKSWVRDDATCPSAQRQLIAYFTGDLKRFKLDLHLDGTEFQRRIWRSLAEIPFGETRSYGWLAARIGSPAASRAVGAANGANPIPIILPCHRVIGSTGLLTGFGGGIETKRFLLQHEGIRVRDDKAERQLTLL